MIVRDGLKATLRVIPIAMSVFLTACQPMLPRESPDAVYSRMLIGTWSNEDYPSNGDFRVYVEITYLPDGSVNGFFSESIRGPEGIFAEVDRITYTSQWRVREGVVEMSDIEYSPAETDQDGLVIRNRIISIEQDRATFQDLTTGSIFERKRVE